MPRITANQARRISLAAQGFNGSRPSGKVDVRHFRKVIDAIGVVQLDSVNVFSRTHYLPFFSRLGAYDRDRLDDWLWSSGEMFEYWAHMASVVPVSTHRLFRWRMESEGIWRYFQKFLEKNPKYLDLILEEVRERGPLQTKDLEDPGSKRGNDTMWNWSDGKMALEWHFVKGNVSTAARPNFVRIYDITERVIAAPHLAAPTPPQDEAKAELLIRAARSLGVGTAGDLADYYRLTHIGPILQGLVDNGHLLEVEVPGWGRPGYILPETKIPRKASGTALLSPFDNLVFRRERMERIWDFHYRIEIYTPAPKRVYGYYVLPFLLDGALVGRVDLKTDRKARALLVRGAFAEPGVDRVAVGRALRAELEAVASWLDLDDIVVTPNGDLAKAIK